MPRRQGPAELATALRGVLKQGRRYKAPRVMPALCVQGSEVADPVKIQTCLEDSFAGPEHGSRASILDIAKIGQTAVPAIEVVDLNLLPSLPRLTEAFLALKPRKAAGLSQIPVEVCMQPLTLLPFTCPSLSRVPQLAYSQSYGKGRKPLRWQNQEKGRTRLRPGEVLHCTIPPQKALAKLYAGSWQLI